jgi:outer membrane protein insertion porin family
MMKRLLAALAGVLIAHAAAAADPFVIRDIRVEGIQRIEPGTVFGYLPVKVGDTMTDERAAETIRALFATGFFRDVRIEREGNILVVSVEERPAIAAIDFTGMKEFQSDQVKKALRDQGIAEGRTFDRAQVEQAEQEIKRQYLTRGKYGARVTTTITPLDRNRVGINFTVDEGEVAKIAAINIVGNQVFSEKTLLDVIVLEPPGWLSWYTKNDQYSRQKLQADLESLRSFYLDRGYLDFNIQSTQVSITPDKRDIYVTINIVEGEKYTVSGVAVAGDTIVPRTEIEKLITLKPGQPFSRRELTDSTKRITDRLGNEGYAFANANAVPEVDKEKRTVAFTMMVDPGRRVYVRRIGIVGNTKTRDEVIRREMRQLEGAFYDGQKLQTSKRRVDRLQYFSEVDIDTEPVAGSTDQVDVTLRVKEKPTGNLLLGFGFSSSDGLILQGSVNQQNLFGTGKSLGISANTSDVNRNIGISFTDPYWTIDGVSLGFDAYNRRFDATRLNIGRYITETLGAGVRLGYPLTETDRINFGLAVEQTSITVFDDSPQRFKDFVVQNGEDPVGVISTVGWIRDRRDSAIWTTSGYTTRILGEVALPVADLKYYKLTFGQAFWYPFTRDLTLYLNGELGYGDGYSDGTLPFFKAYYAGGVSSVRGYEQSSLGPRDINGVVGGSRRVVGNAEFLFPMPGLAQDRSIRLGWFFDVGQVWQEEGCGALTPPGCTLSDLKLRYSTGGVFRWNSPFGPLALVLAFPLNDEEGDRVQRFQFQLGQTF